MAGGIDQRLAEATKLSDDELYRRIGVVASAAQRESADSYVAQGASVFKPVEKMLGERGAEADLLGLGRAFAEKVNKEARELICGSGPELRGGTEGVQEGARQGD